MNISQTSRRQFLKLAMALGAYPLYSQASSEHLKKAIPTSGELLNVIGMGTWQTFNVGSDIEFRNQRTQVLKTFFELGGQMVDSSPMYGSSPEVLGYALDKLNFPKQLFSAEKVWTSDGDSTTEALQKSLSEWQQPAFDLYQIHNLLAWQDHLQNLYELKRQGKIRYVGITTSHGRRHRDLEKIMASEPLDFVQLTYNILDREAESRLLPLAQEKGIAVIANRPFQGGGFLKQLKRTSGLPPWASNLGIINWPQFLLKFIVSHPAITCAIPATTKVAHMHENMGALKGRLPTEKERVRMLTYLQAL